MKRVIFWEVAFEKGRYLVHALYAKGTTSSLVQLKQKREFVKDVYAEEIILVCAINKLKYIQLERVKKKTV